MANSPAPSPGKIYAILDANVLLPPRLSDVLFDMAQEQIYKPRWTADIEAEFIKHYGDVALGGKVGDRSLVERRAEHRLSCFRGAIDKRGFGEHEVLGYHHHHIVRNIPPEVDQDDRHLAAAALKLRDVLSTEEPGAATYLVSDNLTDLAVEQMAALGIVVVSAGRFIDMFVNHPRMEAALSRVVSSLEKPPYSKEALLGALQLHGAETAVGAFSQKWGVAPAKR